MTGFTSVSLRSYSIEEVVDIAAQAGAEIIEWGSDRHIKTTADAQKTKKLCDENNIIVNSYGTYYRTGCCDEKQWDEICKIARTMGAKSIRAWLGKKGSAKTKESEYALLLEDARKTADTAAGYGLVVSYECHPNTYNDTEESCLKFLKDVNRDNVKTYFQSWYRDEKADKSRLLNTFEYVTDVHISFSEMKKFQRFHTKDDEYIEKILIWLNRLNYQGSLIIEFTEKNKGENLIADIKRLNQMQKRLMVTSNNSSRSNLR